MPTEPPLQPNGYREVSAKGTVPQLELTYLRYVGYGLRKQKKTSTQLLMLRFNTKKESVLVRNSFEWNSRIIHWIYFFDMSTKLCV